ncbi:MAG TPA: hypothetical protein ENI91_08845 [Sphingomonadales bacterium]|nr:hypothetical protein [Sphingomonadales bacterium]
MTQRNSALNHIAQQLAAAWQLVRLSPQAIDEFEVTANSFWKSFWVIILVAPLFLIGVYVGSQVIGELENELKQEIVISVPGQIVVFLVQLPLLAIALGLFTKFLKIEKNYSSMIIAYNWLWMVISYCTVPFIILMVAGLIPAQMAALIFWMLMFYFKGYVTWFMFKHSLKISGWLAFGITVFQTLFILSVSQVVMLIFV